MSEAKVASFSIRPLDLGFDVKLHPEMKLELPDGERLRVRYIDRRGQEREFEGPRAAVIETLKASGYRVRKER